MKFEHGSLRRVGKRATPIPTNPNKYKAEISAIAHLTKRDRP
ncbi:MAG: hypothetical protein WBA57_18555 [Elainellaceae cyanobacterium]